MQNCKARPHPNPSPKPARPSRSDGERELGEGSEEKTSSPSLLLEEKGEAEIEAKIIVAIILLKSYPVKMFLAP